MKKHQMYAIGVWIAAAWSLYWMLSSPWIISVLRVLSLLSLAAVGFVMFRNREDTIALGIIIAYGVLNLSLASVLLLGLYLIKRFKPQMLLSLGKALTVICYLPFIFLIIYTLISAVIDIGQIGEIILYNLANLIMSYSLCSWLHNELKPTFNAEKASAGKNKKIAYYEDLYRQGAISEEEFAKKKTEFE